MSALEVALHVDDPQWEGLAPGADSLAVRVAEALAGAVPLDGRPEADIVLIDDVRIAALNTEFRHKDGPTNVLAFPHVRPHIQWAVASDSAEAEPVDAFLGEIYIARETVARQAEEQGKAVMDHLAHLMVHGLLHLLGYDHEIDSEAAEMERAETRILDALGIDDPYR